MLRLLLLTLPILPGPLVMAFSRSFDLQLDTVVFYLLNHEQFEKTTNLGLLEFSLLSLMMLILFWIDNYNLYLEHHKKGNISLLFIFFSVVTFNSMLTFCLGWLSLEYYGDFFNELLIISAINSIAQIGMILCIAVYLIRLAKMSRVYHKINYAMEIIS